MDTRTKPRPTISLSDTKMRLFIDTNVLIGFVEKFNEKKCQTFIELFKNADLSNIELVTSDYVLWELYGHFRDELYVKKLVDDLQYGYISAIGECRRWKSYRKASPYDMEEIGEKIKEYVTQFAENPVSIQKLVSKRLDGFSETIERILQCSRFSYPDTIVFASALFTGSHIIVTLDENFSSKNHLKELKEALENLPLPIDLEFKKPGDFSTEEKAKKNYKAWFLSCNEEKRIGRVIKIWPKENAIAVECSKNYFIRQGDYLCLVRFREGINCIMEIFKVKKGDLWDYKTKKDISQGKEVTIKLPSTIKCEHYMQDSLIFLCTEY